MKEISLLKDLLSIPSVSSNEQELIKFISSKIKCKKYDDFLAYEPDKNVNWFLAVHLDRCGLIYSKGLQYSTILLKPWKKRGYDLPLINQICNRYVGEEMFSNNNKIKITSGKIKGKTIIFESDKRINSGSFQFIPKVKTGERIIGQLDNAISIAILLTHPPKVNILFTTNEEIGESYKQIIKYSRLKNLKKVVILDTTSEKKIHNNIVIREGDSFGDYDQDLVKKIKTFAKSLKVPYKIKKHKSGPIIHITEAGKIKKATKGKIKAATIQIPTINNHYSYEETTKLALERYIKVIKNIDKLKL